MNDQPARLPSFLTLSQPFTSLHKCGLYFCFFGNFNDIWIGGHSSREWSDEGLFGLSFKTRFINYYYTIIIHISFLSLSLFLVINYSHFFLYLFLIINNNFQILFLFLPLLKIQNPNRARWRFLALGEKCTWKINTPTPPLIVFREMVPDFHTALFDVHDFLGLDFTALFFLVSFLLSFSFKRLIVPPFSTKE